MARVMMRCPYDWHREFFTGIEVPRKQGLKGHGNKTIDCPICHRYHYLRRLYFDGDEKPGVDASDRVKGVHALDVGFSFAGEIGIIIGALSLIEGCFPRILSRLTNTSLRDASIIMGLIVSYTHKIAILEAIAKDNTTNDRYRTDIANSIKNLRTAGTIRDKYAHARYSIAGELIHMVPFFGDVKKSQETKILAISDFESDTEKVKEILHAIQRLA